MTTSIDWPSSLPAPLQGTLKGGHQDVFVDDNSAVGSPRRRARFTRGLKAFQFTLRLTEAERVVLQDTFYETTLNNGVRSFNWTNPLTSATYEVRFAGMPEETHLAADFYNVAVTLEQI
jgi:phage-related protein